MSNTELDEEKEIPHKKESMNDKKHSSKIYRSEHVKNTAEYQDIKNSNGKGEAKPENNEKKIYSSEFVGQEVLEGEKIAKDLRNLIKKQNESIRNPNAGAFPK